MFRYVLLALKGCAMGMADVVPGVSGGTIAFISGIYSELIESIKSFNPTALKLLGRFEFRKFWRHINEQLKSAFSRLNSWIPELQQPCFYAQIGALDQSIVVGQHSVGISLDKYMGENYPLYKKFYTPQQRSTMSRQYIVPDCLTFYLLSIYPMDQFDTRPQLDRDLHMGKIMWAVNKAMGKEIFKTKYVNTINAYVKRNPKVTVKQLLKDEDYSPIEALHKD